MSTPAPPVLDAGHSEKLDAFLQEAVQSRICPAVILGVCNKDDVLYYNQAGEKVFGDASQGLVDLDTTTEMFSQSKLVTCIAGLQLVDQGLISLDSEEDIERIAPEIGKLQVLEGYDEHNQPILVPAKRKITLRMLMSHTAGMTYSHSDEDISRWLELNPLPRLFSPDADVKILCTPLMYQPGTSWRYSHSIDWVGIIVERISGLSLEEYMQTHIFAPSGITTMTFYPTAAIKDHKLATCYRDAEGKVVPFPNGFGMGRPIEVEEVKKGLLLGGAGLFGTQRDYLLFLRELLRADPKHHSPHPLISPTSWEELWKPSISTSEGCDGNTKIAAMCSRPGYFDPPQAPPELVNHSVGFLINLSPFGGRRRAISGCWSGAAKTQFWIDPSTGIAGIAGTQLLSPAPDPWFKVLTDFERLVYQGLQSSQ